MKLIQSNNVDVIIQNNKLTPRTAVCCYFSINKPEKYAGAYSLFAKLLLQGTKKRSAKDLALELENNAIETTTKAKQDYIRVTSLFLNEDFDLALDILADLLENSTFDDFEKEVHKIRGEITSELDMPKTKASDAFIGEIFKGHYYENGPTKTLNELDRIKKEDMLEILEQLRSSKKVVSIVGDFEDMEQTAQKIAEKLSIMQNPENYSYGIPEVQALDKDVVVKMVKNDAQQAQIIQGWVVESLYSEDYAKIIVTNNLLGASGLSSRLFYELRDKQGLAYTVRSSYEVLERGAIWNIYIATSPKNIKQSLDGFMAEIKKLQETLISEEELQGAKENVLGRLEYFSQTNMHIASTKGYDYILGLGTEYEEKYKKEVNSVTAQDVMDMARKYFTRPSVATILAPKEFMEF